MDLFRSAADLPPAIADAIARRATVITSNQRAARTLRRAYDRKNRDARLRNWQPPSVLAWDSWMAELWRTALLQGNSSLLLLNRTQEHVVWRSIIVDDPEKRDALRSADSLAELAADAWRRVCQYSGLGLLSRFSSSFETRSFQRWRLEFERRCRKEQWISPALLEEALTRTIHSRAIGLPAEVLLVGFDDLSPARQNLIVSARETGAIVDTFKLDRPLQKPVLVQVDTELDEIHAAARWARSRLQQKPRSKIAVIVPSVELRRPVIKRVFRYILAPELENIAAPNQAAPYEFSVGSNLAETPLVRVAVNLLRWVSGPLAIEQVSALLVSPLFAMGNGEASARAIFDALEVRKSKLLHPEVSLRWIIDIAIRTRRRAQPEGLLMALRSLERAANRHGVATGTRTFGEWTEVIRDLLREARWGHTSAEDSVEFQTRKRWDVTLDELATLDFDGSRIRFTDMLEALERLVRTTAFAPESRETPIQILGPLEAAGSSFDAIWFVGAGDSTWPAGPAASPLLPWSFEMELGMPGADTLIDDARSRKLAQRISDSGDTVVFSYATEVATGKQRPAPALGALEFSAVSIDLLSPADAPTSPLEMEAFTDSIPLRSLPDKEIQGGVEILKLQAACGFRAFAEKRLWSTELTAGELGMDAGERGNVVHRSLEYFWDEVKTQSELKLMLQDQRTAALNRAIEHGIRRVAELASTDWDAAYLEVQRRRLRSLLSAWLEIELLRDPFEVKQREKELRDAHIGPLRIKVRVDRVDATEAGDVIIDYKTGRAKPDEWRGDRPDAPQLPLYAVLSNAQQPDIEIADVAFASLRIGREMVLDGFASKVTAFEKKPAQNRLQMPEQLDQWRSVLVELAEQFHRGDVVVDPKKYPGTCKYCAQRTLCRLDPGANEIDEELDEQAANDTGNG